MSHECEQKDNISALRRDVADLAVCISSLKDTIASIDKTAALMEQRMGTLATYIEESNTRYEKHIDEGKSWRIGVILALFGTVGTFAYALVNYGVLTEKVSHSEKLIEARTFG